MGFLAAGVVGWVYLERLECAARGPQSEKLRDGMRMAQEWIDSRHDATKRDGTEHDAVPARRQEIQQFAASPA